MSENVQAANAVSFDISDYLTDAKSEIEGVWRSIGRDPAGNVREVKLARVGNDDYNAFLRKEQRAHSAVLDQQDEEAFKLADQINIRVLATCVIRGLRVNGADVPYTVELGKQLLSNKDFRSKVNALAQQADAYKAQKEAEVVKS